MALNYSQRSIFPAHLSEEKLVHGCSKEDIHDILPVDPFGMDISSTFTAITGWLQDLGVSNYGGCRRDEVGSTQNPIFNGWDLMWDTAMDFQDRVDGKKADNVVFGDDRFDGFVTEEALDRFVVDSGIDYGYDCFPTEDDLVFGCGGSSVHGNKDTWSCNNLDDRMFSIDRIDAFLTYEALRRSPGVESASLTHVDDIVDQSGDGTPHPALSFALAYLGVRDLLSVERVCKSLQYTIKNDPLLWKTIQFDHPLNERVTDDILLHLTERAQGHLQCLNLEECTLITDDGLKRVLEINLRLIKLSVSGCIKVSIGGLMSCLKTFQPKAVTGIKCLRVAGRPVTLEQFEELTSFLGVHNHAQPNHHKPHFFSTESLYLSCEDDRIIDIELCPKCEMAKLVYDCTAQSCQGIDQVDQLCRACIHCIRRCDECGRCIDGVKYVETFYLSYQCSDCSSEMSNCQMGQDIGSRFSEDVLSCELDG